MGDEAYSRTHPRSQDFSRTREQTSEPAKNYISYGTVGHYDSTPAYARIEGGDVLVEVTLVPAGDEVVARLDLDTVDGGGRYFPISYGQRVIVGFPNGENGDPVILGRVSDGSWPFPAEVAGITTGLPIPLPPPVPNPAPAFAFIKTQDGQLFALETGDGADVLLHSGASVQMKAQASGQILATGRTHIGTGADFSTPPEGAKVADSGFVEAGSSGGPYEPTPNTNPILPDGPPMSPTNPTLPLPADGFVRIKDPVQSNIAIDPAFWAWIIGVQTFILACVDEAGMIAGNAVFAAAFADPPVSIDSKPAGGSMNTAGDD